MHLTIFNIFWIQEMFELRLSGINFEQGFNVNYEFRNRHGMVSVQ